MRTSIRGKESEWTDEIWALWKEKVGNVWDDGEGEVILSSNYFTPRPFVDEWNRGSSHEGFVFSTNRRKVYEVSWIPS